MIKNNNILQDEQKWSCENNTKNSKKINIFYRKTLFFTEKRFYYKDIPRLK